MDPAPVGGKLAVDGWDGGIPPPAGALTSEGELTVGYQLKVSTDDVAAKASAIQTKATYLEEQVAELSSMMAALAETWTGTAASAFQDLYATWKGQATQIQVALADVSRALNNAGTNYANAESANTRTFSR